MDEEEGFSLGAGGQEARRQGAREHKRRMKEAQGARRRQELEKIVTTLCGSILGLGKVPWFTSPSPSIFMIILVFILQYF